ncbi:hypothetical protein M433DRAFT_3386 [Acidomyces richmondensis BFW]|nr:MAG: hypothetical protein FE78DRAFT_26953 [Acidomyces sp. 'richmondensis']KYG46844.1 hypothetical protein M433DRAFT_3386 [Acidomyces richmondensis BFW]
MALGRGIGVKSAIVPIHTAECTPPEIRGALVNKYAMADVTSLGIMVGYASDLAFYKVTKKPNITGLNWRMMMALATLRYCGRLCIHGLEVTEMYRLLEKKFVSVPRNRRAIMPSEIVMLMQQFCEVNVIAYYSTAVFVNEGFP